MHSSVHEFFENNVDGNIFKNAKVIEVGSLDVNGSVRERVMSFNPKSYVGIDFVDGEGVDKLMNAEDLAKEFGKASFDVVISTEMLEHAENWRECVQNMKDIAKDWIIITTRGIGFPTHAYPDDFWRYTNDDIKKIFADCELVANIPDPEAPGVFVIARKKKGKRTDLSKIEVYSQKEGR